MEDNFYDRNGWGVGYALDGTWGNGAFPAPPGDRSHNIYTQNNIDFTSKTTLSCRAASQGFQNRTGGHDSMNITFANPMAGNNLGRPENQLGPYSFTSRHVVTQGFEHLPTPLYGEVGSTLSGSLGKQRTGYNPVAYQMTYLHSPHLHCADPNDAGDTTLPRSFGISRDNVPISAGGRGDFFNIGGQPEWLVYGWAEPDTENGAFPVLDNAAFVDQALINNVTLQLYTDILLGRPAGTTTGTDDLINHLRGLDDLRGVCENMNDYFMNGIAAAGLTGWAIPAKRTLPTVVDFQPEERGIASGKRWDTEIDWATGDYAGFVAGDEADLQGIHVAYNLPHAIELSKLTLGINGGMIACCGAVTVTGTTSFVGTGFVKTNMSGLVKLNGYSGPDGFSLETEGGMLANLGTIAGNTSILVGGYDMASVIGGYPYNAGYLILATAGQSCTISAGQTLEIQGHGLAIFDGTGGTATVTMAATAATKFTAAGGVMGMLREFQTGIFGDTPPNVASAPISLAPRTALERFQVCLSVMILTTTTSSGSV